MNFGDNEIFISTPQYLWAMAEMIQSWGVKPELEVFDLGQIWFALVSMISVATTYDSASYTLASTATWELKEGDDPARWHRLFWAGVLGLLPILMMWVGGLQIIRSGVLIASLPLLFVDVAMAVSLRKSLRADEQRHDHG